jgi:DNA adenine methylase
MKSSSMILPPTIFSFWYSVLNFTDELIHIIEKTSVSMDEWYKQKQIFTECDTSQPLGLGFATFFLNRTNRSGILNAGVVGGKNQTGEWKLDARFPKESLIKKIQHIGKYRHKITLCNLDARVFILKFANKLQKNSLIYLDPPYFHKGQKLYLNALRPDDHILIAHCITNHIAAHWITSYDSTPEISSLYSNYRQASYNLNYTAANRYHGSEIVIYSHKLKIPSVENPFTLSKEKFIALCRF